MTRPRWCCVLTLLFGVYPPLQAAVIERDWKTPGDGLLTYDDVNKREWLDLSQTLLTSQFPGEDASPYVTRENRYQYVVAQTELGGRFGGFAVAKRPDVIALADSAGINTSFRGAPNSVAALTLAQLVGFTVERSTGLGLSIGLLDEPSSGIGIHAPIRPGAHIDSLPNQAGLAFGEAHFEYRTPPGVMLFRVVPEPSAISLAFLASVIHLLLSRRSAV
ncbi:MAG: hypothetical protein IT424_11825 [Pirellulales bacterium]|nr:hypothetical protein [Pirellulales bacterium]